MEEKINKIIEDIQESQVRCGGRFIRKHEVESMTVKDLLHLLIPNNVTFEVYLKIKARINERY